MANFKGTASGSISVIPYQIAATIKSWSLVNNTAGAITVNLYIGQIGVPTKVWSGSIAANATERSDHPISMNGMYEVTISTSGSLDYYFSCE